MDEDRIYIEKRHPMPITGFPPHKRLACGRENKYINMYICESAAALPKYNTEVKGHTNERNLLHVRNTGGIYGTAVPSRIHFAVPSRRRALRDARESEASCRLNKSRLGWRIVPITRSWRTQGEHLHRRPLVTMNPRRRTRGLSVMGSNNSQSL